MASASAGSSDDGASATEPTTSSSGAVMVEILVDGAPVTFLGVVGSGLDGWRLHAEVGNGSAVSLQRPRGLQGADRSPSTNGPQDRRAGYRQLSALPESVCTMQPAGLCNRANVVLLCAVTQDRRGRSRATHISRQRPTVVLERNAGPRAHSDGRGGRSGRRSDRRSANGLGGSSTRRVWRCVAVRFGRASGRRADGTSGRSATPGSGARRTPAWRSRRLRADRAVGGPGSRRCRDVRPPGRRSPR